MRHRRFIASSCRSCLPLSAALLGLWLTGVRATDLASAPKATSRFPARPVWGDYAVPPRLTNGHVDADALAVRLKELHANTYLWLIYTEDVDWNGLKTFLPKAAAVGVDVWAYLVPPSEPPAPEPFKYDYPRWGEEIARLSLQYSNLTAWVIDDFYANKKLLTPQLIREMQTRAKEINPRLAFLPLMYFPELGVEFLNGYREVIDGVVVAYPRDSEEIAKASAILNDRPWTDFEFRLDHVTPTKLGDFIGAQLEATVSGGEQRLRFREMGGYPGTPSGYHLKEVLVDGAAVWTQDGANGRPWWHDVDVDVTTQAREKKRVTISFRLTERQGVSDFAFTWSLRDMRTEGLRLESDFTQPEKWKVEKQGPFTTGFGNEQPMGKGGFHVPFIVMTAAQAEEFKGRHGEPNSPERIAEWVRFSLDAHRAGLCEGVVTYALDKSTNNPYFDAVRREALRFGKPRE